MLAGANAYGFSGGRWNAVKLSMLSITEVLYFKLEVYTGGGR